MSSIINTHLYFCVFDFFIATLSYICSLYHDLYFLIVRDAESDDKSLKEALATSQRLLRLIRNETGNMYYIFATMTFEN